MNDGEMTEAQFLEFLAGWRTAQRGEAFWEHNTDEWKSGFAFWKQVQAEKTGGSRTCH